MIRRPPRSTQSRSSAASDVYKRQHRGCASVPPELYKTLSNSDEPFVCLSCSSSHFKQQIADLSATVVALKEELKDALEIRETCSALACEISALRQALNSLEKEVSKPRQAKYTYAAALSSRSKSSQSISKLASTAPTALSSGAPQNKQQLKNNDSKPSEPKHKVKVAVSYTHLTLPTIYSV